jgi:hypothetical protein
MRRLLAFLGLAPKRNLDHTSFSGPKSALLRRLPDDELVKWTAKWAAGTARRTQAEAPGELAHRLPRLALDRNLACRLSRTVAAYLVR